MSYNITRMKVSKVSLRLPLDFDFMMWIAGLPERDEKGYENIGRRWCLEDPTTISSNLADRTWKLSLFGEDDKVIKGIIEDEALVACALEDWEGDGSGYLHDDVLLPLFKEFKGTLEAIVVWEGGDSIKRLSIYDGVVEETEVE